MPVKRQYAGASRRSNLWTLMSVAAVVLTAVTLTYILFVEASPPKSIVIAAGAKDGEYFLVAQKYAQDLHRHGISAKVRETKGSAENLELLSTPGGDVAVALVQGGMADPERHAQLRALGSLYREPLWIFLRQDVEATRLAQLAGLRIAVGAEGSGTRQVALQLLEASGVKSDQATLVDAGGQKAAELLEQGSVDAACFVAGIDAAYVQRLGHSLHVKLMSLEQQQALTRRFRELSAVTVPPGLLDLAGHIPAHEAALVAPTAMLVARPTLHPAVSTVLLEAARRVHAAGDALAEPREFPSSHYVDLPLSDEAERYYRYGPPLLQRLLPYWLATFVDRVKFLALPLLVLIMPFIRATPPLLRWRTRRKVYRWYGRLRELDHLISQGMSPAEAKSRLEELRVLESQIAHVDIPLSYMDEYYNLKVHLNLVHRGLAELAGSTSGFPA